MLIEWSMDQSTSRKSVSYAILFSLVSLSTKFFALTVHHMMYQFPVLTFRVPKTCRFHLSAYRGRLEAGTHDGVVGWKCMETPRSLKTFISILLTQSHDRQRVEAWAYLFSRTAHHHVIIHYIADRQLSIWHAF